MRKISLDVDTLEVTTFATEPEPDATRGTVEAYATPGCGTTTCATRLYGTMPCATCEAASCVDTCGYPYKPAC